MKFTDDEISLCINAMDKPAPRQALELIASGRIIVSLSKDRREVYVETYNGELVRDPDFPDRKMGMAGAWPLFRAGMIDQFGCITQKGRDLLTSIRT